MNRFLLFGYWCLSLAWLFSCGIIHAQVPQEANSRDTFSTLADAMFEDASNAQAMDKHLNVWRGLDIPARIGIPVCIRLLDHKTWSVRAEALSQLGEYGSASKVALPAILELLSTDAEKKFGMDGQTHAVQVLGKIGVASPQVLNALSQLVARAPTSEYRRIAAVTAIGSFRAKSGVHVPQLEALLNDYYVELRVAAYESIGRITNAIEPSTLKPETAVRDLPKLSPKDGFAVMEWVRQNPKEAGAFFAHLKTAYHDNDCPSYIRLSVVQTLPSVTSATPVALGVLFDALERKKVYFKTPDEQLNKAARTSFRQIDCNDDRSLPLLIGRLSSDNQKHSHLASDLLGKLGPLANKADEAFATRLATKPAKPDYRTLLKFQKIQRRYMEAIKKIGPGCTESAAVIRSLLPEDSFIHAGRAKTPRQIRLRAFCLATLAAIGPEAVLPAKPLIADLLQHTGNPLLFAAAARAVGEMGEAGKEFAPELVNALQPNFRIKPSGHGIVIDNCTSFAWGGPDISTSMRLESMKALVKLGPLSPEAQTAINTIANQKFGPQKYWLPVEEVRTARITLGENL